VTSIPLTDGPNAWFDLLLVSASELDDLARKAGWKAAVADESEPPDVYAVLEPA
jgi:hypothetical protein